MARSHPLLTKRLVLRPFRQADITDEYLGWLNDRDLMRHSRQRLTVHTQDLCKDYLRSFTGTPNYFWNVEHLSGRQIGTVTAYVTGDVADVGLMIGVPRQGYGSEAFRAVLDYLFEKKGVDEVTIGTVPENVPMLKTARRAGMHYRGEITTWTFAIPREEWNV